MNTYAVDFETYYDNECSVKKLGNRGYFSHPQFDPYLVTVVSDHGYEYVGCPRQFDWGLLNDALVVSHNASFDETLYLFGVEQGWWSKCSPAAWHCTADMAAYLGLPRNLQGAALKALEVEVNKETRDKMKGRQWATMDADFRAEVCRYALDDARLCLRLWQTLAPQWTETERAHSVLTRKICRQGLPVDEALIKANAEKLRTLLWECEQAIPWRDTGALLSRKESNKACRAAGITPPKSWAMGDPECDAWLDKHAETFPWVYAVRNWRRINSLLKKVESFDAGTDAGRYYGGLLYWGAHTGRWSGSGGNLNLQNLPRGDMFGVNLRSQIRATPGNTLVVVDLSQIEVRTLCWLAKDHDTLEEIRQTDDMYEAFAIRFGLWSKDQGRLRDQDSALRHKVKGMVLGCGYGASANKYALIMGCPYEEAEAAVELYASKMQRVKKLWKKFRNGIECVANKSEYRVSLPSGNDLVYRNISRGSEALTCVMVRNGREMAVRPWYGMITENASQKLARDIFAHQLQKIDEAGHKIILHVHDEVVIECPAEQAEAVLAEVTATMSTPPAWIPDIPLAAEGQITQAYTK
jgi:DNA polymerase